MTELHPCVFNVSTEQTIYLDSLLINIRRARWYIHVRLDAVGLCAYDDKVENCTRIHVLDPCARADVFDLWEAINRHDDFDCCWVEWGEYRGCILELENTDETD